MSTALPESGITWTTAVSAVEPELLYRGYRVDELAERASYLESAYLLIAGELPTTEAWADWQALLQGGLMLPDGIASWVTRVPAAASPMEVLSAALTRIRLSEGALAPGRTRDVLDHFPQWLGFLTAVVAGRVRWSRGEPVLEPRDDFGFVGNLWWLFQGREPTAAIERALETLLILGAEHGLAAGTIAVRLAAGVDADFAAALQAGVSVAMSRYPVGQAASTLDVLRDVRSNDRARDWVAARLETHQSIPGFEHRVYRVGDPRTDVVAALCRKFAERSGRQDREELAAAIEGAVWDQAQRLPSVSWPAARLLDYLGFDRSVFGPLYVISRLAGWTAHYVEQREQGRLPATSVNYQGPPPRSFAVDPERT